jgi:hypothetical protein
MAVPTIVIDGSQTYSSYSIAINGTIYIFDDIKITRAVEKAQDNLANGAPGRARYTAGRATGTATLQIGTSGLRPKLSDTFSQQFDVEYGTELWVLMPVDFDASSSPNEIRKISISFEKVYNGSVSTVA